MSDTINNITLQGEGPQRHCKIQIEDYTELCNMQDGLIGAMTLLGKMQLDVAQDEHLGSAIMAISKVLQSTLMHEEAEGILDLTLL